MALTPADIESYKYHQEWWKLGVSVLTPITIAILTYFVTSSLNERESTLRRGEQISLDKQKIYSSIGPCLNTIYVYILDYGDYASYTPDQILNKKRDADRLFFVYKPYWSDKTVNLYGDFMNAAFETFSGFASDAKIRSWSDQKRQALTKRGIAWQEKWDSLFTEQLNKEVTDKYYSLTASMLVDAATSTINNGDAKKKM